MTVLAILLFLLFVNLTAAALFAFDKMQSVSGGQRVPERTLLSVAFFGGWIGAKWAQRRFGHKTRKQPFGRRLSRIPFLQAAVIAALLHLAEGGGATPAGTHPVLRP